jgi:hypothetical protein
VSPNSAIENGFDKRIVMMIGVIAVFRSNLSKKMG